MAAPLLPPVQRDSTPYWLSLPCCYVGSRQKEMEEKLIEEEVARRVDTIVKQRVEEELERRQGEIEAEVRRRVEEAKAVMERQMLEELERERQRRIEEEKIKQVKGRQSARQRGYKTVASSAQPLAGDRNK